MLCYITIPSLNKALYLVSCIYVLREHYLYADINIIIFPTDNQGYWS